MQLGKLAGLTMYGIASNNKHFVLREMGAIPIDYRTQDFVEVIRQEELDGLDAVFEGMSGDCIRHGLSLLRLGGKLVSYGEPPGRRCRNCGEFSGKSSMGRDCRLSIDDDMGDSAEGLDIGQRIPIYDDYVSELSRL